MKTVKTARFKNNKIITLIKEKEEMSKTLTAMNEKWQKEDIEAKKILQRIERIKEKINPIIATEIKKLNILEEFDVVTTAKYDKDEVVAEILNQVEMFKEQLRTKPNEDKETKNKKS